MSLALSVPVLPYSPALQSWLNFSMSVFSGSQWLGPLFAIIVFACGGVPFLQMAVPELKNRQPGMMTLISLAISVAFVYSVATLFVLLGKSFFWELVTLIDVMLLGHWLEMRSVRQASGALNELARLMPDTAERIKADDSIEEVNISQLSADDKVLVDKTGPLTRGQQNAGEPGLGQRLQHHRPAAGSRSAGAIRHSAVAGGGRAVDVAQYHCGGHQRPTAAPDTV